jgi:SnoaL-like domain
VAEEDLAARIAHLEARVEQLEDEKAIRDLLTHYSFGADLFRGSAWVDLWTEEGVYDLYSGGQNGPPIRHAGSAELMQLITGPGMPPEGRSQHHTDGPVIVRIEGDRAFVEGYSITLVNRPTGNEVWNMGFSSWILQKVDGRWRIVERLRREVGDPEQSSVIGTAWMSAAGVDAEPSHGD